ncbi:MAG: rod shape-determining protein MreC [Arcobacteraceae bacterium]
MNKKFTLFLIILTIGILYFFNVEKIIQNKLSTLNQSIQKSYINIFVSINDVIEKYVNQTNSISKLKSSNDEHLKYKLLYDVKVNELNELNNNLNIIKPLDLKLDKVKVLSYYKFNDYSRVIIDKKDLNSSKIYSLITFDGFSAGIVVNKSDSSVAYLNENSKCNYTVFIGKNNVPGITSGILDDGQLLIKYVPIWQNISIGDEVITSSMDSIFPFGIKVGKVTNIDIQDNIQEVLVTPYAHTLGTRYYYLYDNHNNIMSNN